MNPHERRGGRPSDTQRPGGYRRDSGQRSRSVSPRGGGRDNRRDNWAPDRDSGWGDRDRGRAQRDSDPRYRQQDREWGRDRGRDRDRGGGRSHWLPPSPRSKQDYYNPPPGSRSPGEIHESPGRADAPRDGRLEPEVNEQLGAQVDSLARALVDVIQRTGKQSIAKRALDIRSRFGGEGATGDAKKNLETADNNVKEGMAALQGSFVKLLREALSGVGPGIRGQSLNTADLEAIRDRIERVEQRQSRAASPAVDKGKGRALPPPPPSVPPPEPPSAPPSAPASEAGASAAPQAAGAGAQSESPDAKRRKARRLLEELIKRVEEVEEKTDRMTERYDDVLNEVTEHNMNIILQSDEIEDVKKELEALKARRRRRQTAEATAEPSAQASEEPVPVPAPTSASEPVPTLADNAPALATSSQVDRGEADMDIDEESQPSGRPSVVPETPKGATSELATQVAALRDQMAAMKERMDALQSKAGEAATDPVTAPEPAKVPPMDAATASRMGLAVTPQPEKTPTPSDSVKDAIAKLQADAEALAAKLATLEERVGATVARADLDAMFAAERGRVILEAQEVVQGLLDQDRLNVARQASDLCITDVTARMDELVKQKVTPLVEQALVSIASKTAASGSASRAPSSSPSVPLQQRLPAATNPVPLQQRTSAPVPLQHRMQGNGQNGTQNVGPLSTQTLTQVQVDLDLAKRMFVGPDVAPQAANPNTSNQPKPLTDAERAFMNQVLARPQSSTVPQFPQSQQGTLPSQPPLPHSPTKHSQAPVLSRTPSQPNIQQPPSAQALLTQRLNTHSAQSPLSPNPNSRNSTPEVAATNLPTVSQQSQSLASASVSPTISNHSGVGISQQAGRRSTPVPESTQIPSPEQLSKAGLSPESILLANIDALYKYKILRQYPGFLESHPDLVEQAKARFAEQQRARAQTQVQARQAQAVQQAQLQPELQLSPAVIARALQLQAAQSSQAGQQSQAQAQPQQAQAQERTLEQLVLQQALQDVQQTQTRPAVQAQEMAQQLGNPQQSNAALQAQIAQRIQQQLRQSGQEPSSLPLLQQQLLQQQQQQTQQAAQEQDSQWRQRILLAQQAQTAQQQDGQGTVARP